MTLLDLVQESGISLSKRGNRYWFACPFHGDNNPSANVSDVKDGQVWYCYTCKKGGGAIEFLMYRDDIPSYEAKRRWATLNNQPIPQDGREYLISFVNALGTHTYLSTRGIKEGTATRFTVGFCDDYHSILKKIGLDPNYAEQLGLWDVSGRMVYPFFDSDGVYKIATRSIEDKFYRNSPETSLYHKNGFWGLQNIRGSEVYIFEGYHDAMVASQAGYPAVASCGTHIKQEMWLELQRLGITSVIVVPDGDRAGINWIESLAQTAPEISMQFIIPKGDPDDEILTHGSLDHLKKWNPFEWWITSKYSPTSVADRISMLNGSRSVFMRMPSLDKRVAKSWYASTFNDESVGYLEDVQSNIQAEKVVLANSLVAQSARLEAQTLLTVSDFTGKLHRKIFEDLCGDISLQYVKTEYNEDLSAIADPVNYQLYIEKVAQIGQSRKIARAIENLDWSNPLSIIDDLYAITDKIQTINGAELMDGTLRDIESKLLNPNNGINIPNFNQLSTLINFKENRYHIISGNSGHGKTTMLCNIIDYVIEDHSVLFFSLEMSAQEIMYKLLTIRSGMATVKLNTGNVTVQELAQLKECAGAYPSHNLEIINNVSDVRKMQAIVKSRIARGHLKYVMIDYLQLLTVKNQESRWEQLISISKAMKEMSNMGVVVIALTQLNRTGLREKTVDANDQAGAYGIIAPADTAIAVQKVKDKAYNYLVKVDKNRHGWDGVEIECVFDRNRQVISEV